jgi:hypothetical protein
MVLSWLIAKLTMDISTVKRIPWLGWFTMVM